MRKRGSSFEKNESLEQTQESSVERRARLQERLVKLEPMFLEIRQKMGIKENIGFGSLPEVHNGGPSLGSLPELEKKKDGTIDYTVLNLFHTQKIPLPKEELKNILVMPDFSLQGEKRIVSISDPDDNWRTEKDFSMAYANDDVYIGVMAHEMAHTFDEKTEFPSEILTVLKNRYKEEFDTDREWKYDSRNDEAGIDLIAALFGYKEQIIAKADFMIERLNRLGLYGDKEELIKQVERRKQEVLKYCP